MEFGRVETEELNKIDFSLPQEPSFNKKVLSGIENVNTKVYVGCAKWGSRHLVGYLR